MSGEAVSYGAVEGNDSSNDHDLFPSSSQSHLSSSSIGNGHHHHMNMSDDSDMNDRTRAAHRTARYGIAIMLMVGAVIGVAFFVAFTYGDDSATPITPPSAASSSSSTNVSSLPAPSRSTPTSPSSSSPSSSTSKEKTGNDHLTANADMGVTTTTLGDAYPRVKVSVYYDSLCPFSQKFLVGTLWDVWNAEGVSDIIDLQLIPYGNTKEFVGDNGRYNFTCQHGPAECDGNMLQSCAVQTLGNAAAYQYIYCMSKSGNPNANAARCAESNGIEYGALRTCVKLHGDELLHRMGYLTDLLYPAHEYVPWITINSFPIEDPSQLLRMICKLHMGPRPSGCSLRLKASTTSGTSPRTDGEYNN